MGRKSVHPYLSVVSTLLDRIREPHHQLFPVRALVGNHAGDPMVRAFFVGVHPAGNLLIRRSDIGSCLDDSMLQERLGLGESKVGIGFVDHRDSDFPELICVSLQKQKSF